MGEAEVEVESIDRDESCALPEGAGVVAAEEVDGGNAKLRTVKMATTPEE